MKNWAKFNYKFSKCDKILDNLLLDHEYIKDRLKAIGAINIDVGVHDKTVDIGTYDLKTRSLKTIELLCLAENVVYLEDAKF